MPWLPMQPLFVLLAEVSVIHIMSDIVSKQHRTTTPCSAITYKIPAFGGIHILFTFTFDFQFTFDFTFNFKFMFRYPFMLR